MSFEIFIFQAFHHAYSFLNGVRAKEKEQLKQELKTLTDSKRKDKIKYLLQRMVICPFNQSGKIKKNKTCNTDYIWLNQLSNTTNLWWIDVYYIVINYMFRRLWPSSG